MAETTKKSRNEGGGFISGITTYIKEVRAEMNKVTWPSREEVVRLTRIVLIVTVLSALVLGGISIALTEYMRIGFANPVLFIITFAVIIGVTIWQFRDGGGSSY